MVAGCISWRSLLLHYSHSHTGFLCVRGLSMFISPHWRCQMFCQGPHDNMCVRVCVYSYDLTFFRLTDKNKAFWGLTQNFGFMWRISCCVFLRHHSCGLFNVSIFSCTLHANVVWGFDITALSGQCNSVCSPWYQNSKPSSLYLNHLPSALSSTLF